MERMEDFRGKRLLILGASPSETSLVLRAKKYGIYTIVTDNNPDRNIARAKQYADEAWDVSWSDLDTLEELCRSHQVDGITAGYSEFRVENLIKLCSRLGLPCYSTMEQLEITRDKAKFKQECRENGVPVVHGYDSVEEVNCFPVIVKPVDRGGSIGISVAGNRQELYRAYEYAMNMSVCKQVIIEDFIDKGTKFDVYYAIADGEITLLTSNDVVNAEKNGFERVVQSSWLFPSTHHDAFIQKVDSQMRKMLQHMGIENGYIFFSGFVDKEDNFCFFETGFRLGGGHLYEFLERKGIVNNLDIFIAHALSGASKAVHIGNDRLPDLKCVTINLYAKSGVLNSISGFEAVEELDSCKFVLVNAHTGQECDGTKAILTKIGMFYCCDDSPVRIRKDVDRAYSLIKAVDDRGEDMIYDRINTSLIDNWWN